MNDPAFGYLLHDVARLLRKRFDQKAKDLGLTRAQWRVIAHLAKNEGMHQAALADLLEIEPITLVRILDRLAEQGLIERRQHPTDRRIWTLFLKDAARPLLLTLRPIGDTTRAEAFAGISEADQDSLTRTLAQMKSNLAAACCTAINEKELSHG
jgi:MarR family transcriptional regulator, transcriptional regulator for hemolysin